MVSELALWSWGVILSLTAAILSLYYLEIPNIMEPLPEVVTTVVLPENVPCLPPFRLLANFRYSTRSITWMGHRRILMLSQYIHTDKHADK